MMQYTYKLQTPLLKKQRYLFIEKIDISNKNRTYEF